MQLRLELQASATLVSLGNLYLFITNKCEVLAEIPLPAEVKAPPPRTMLDSFYVVASKWLINKIGYIKASHKFFVHWVVVYSTCQLSNY